MISILSFVPIFRSNSDMIFDMKIKVNYHFRDSVKPQLNTKLKYKEKYKRLKRHSKLFVIKEN